MDVGNYLFGFNGRINRAKWWIFVLIAIIYSLIVQWVILRSFAITNLWIYIALQLPLWYVAIAVGIKRLHDRNKGAIWALLFYGVPIIISCYTTYMSWGAMSAAMAITQATSPEQMQQAAQAMQEAAQGMAAGMGSMYYILMVIELVIAVWGLVELGILKGTTGDNQYGPDPLANVPH